jgi:small subunit ribosomal protein S17e
LDFDINKKVVEEVAIIASKRLRNKIAGFVTHLMRRIQKGSSVKGISLKLQEEEREKRMDFVPEVSEVDKIIDAGIEVDDDVSSMLASIGFADLSKVTKVSANQYQQQQRRPRKPRTEGGAAQQQNREQPQQQQQQ